MQDQRSHLICNLCVAALLLVLPGLTAATQIFSPVQPRLDSPQAVVHYSANGESASPSISADGRFVAFASEATDLLSPGLDTNGKRDIFVYDRQTDQTRRVSLFTSGSQGNCDSFSPSISGDGRYVAFSSCAPDFSGGGADPPRFRIYVFDCQESEIEKVSVDNSGGEGNDDSTTPDISTGGRFVVFASLAENLIWPPEFDLNSAMDIFIRDRQSQLTERVSISSNGDEADQWSYHPQVSASGRFVVFESDATNLVAFDSNGHRDIFLRDRDNDTTTRVSVTSQGFQLQAASDSPSISDDGQFVTFASASPELVSGKTGDWVDLFIHNVQTGTTDLVSVSNTGEPGNAPSWGAQISSDGRVVYFKSLASNLVPGDEPGTMDLFLRDRLSGTTERIFLTPVGGEVGAASLSSDARHFAYDSVTDGMVLFDFNELQDIFVIDRRTAKLDLVSFTLFELPPAVFLPALQR